ncbi:MAG TPA: P1 family peptidase [Gemmatimonadales bacterium]|nr:P1 family peptidase [Gemmatimonadales bacterium]
MTRFPLLFLILLAALPGPADARQRARALGIAPGFSAPGPHNAITDVPGVRVGHATIREGDSVRTGVTAILPHGGNLFQDRVPAAVHVGNGFGKLLGSTQVHELGELESPILLTCTLCVWRAADALVGWMLEQPGMGDVRSINPLVAETNDGFLSAIRSRPVRPEHVRAAIARADSGPVAEGSVGAGTGTIAFGWKGGIGTASRKTGASGYTVGVLVQANFGGASQLMILGVPVGRTLNRSGVSRGVRDTTGAGSIIIVVATDAPLLDRNLRRLAARAMLGLGRTGGTASNGSGDYVIAFSTNPAVRRARGARDHTFATMGNDALDPLFQAVVEATEEANYNALFMATTTEGNGNRALALPAAEVRRILQAQGRVPG